jgi:cytochrome b involved in lipid metabolism
MKKLIIIAVVVLVAVGGLVFLTGSNKPVVSPTPPAELKNYTLSQVSQHKDASSCYSAINGSVYDLTTWINQHPGGEQAILSICGKDGSAAFNAQHGGAQRQADILVGFKIGTLVQ